jgi:glycosyltransferase involved in cell wall biosynthesis
MKILQIIDKLNVGGAERVFVDMCNILYENNYNVTAFLLLDEGVLDNDLNNNLSKIYLRRRNKWNVIKMIQCASILKKYDIIHCHCRHVYKYIRLVDLLFFTNRKIIFQDHYGSINIDKKAPLFFKTFLKPRYYIGVSKVLVNWSKDILNIKLKNIFLLQNCIVKHKNAKSKVNKPFDFILVSNIKNVKNQIFAIDLVNKLNKKLLLIGHIQDVNYFQQFEENIKKNIVLKSNLINVQAVINDGILGLHTSKSETGPLVLIEYLAQGLPFLAYDTGEVASILKPYFPEYFMDNFDIDKWEQRITKLLKETPDYDKMNFVFEKHFGKEQYFEKLNAIYTCIKN